MLGMGGGAQSMLATIDGNMVQSHMHKEDKLGESKSPSVSGAVSFSLLFQS